MTEPQHPFDSAIALTDQQGSYHGHTSAHYGNMVGPFGGITAATLLQAVLQHPLRLGDPVSLTVNFAAPIADGPFIINARPARTNRSTQHWLIELSQQEQIAATATAVFAVRRETWSATELECPAAPPAETLEAFPRGRGLPAWTNSYELRFVEGGFSALSGAQSNARDDSSSSLQWVRDEPPRPLDFPALAAICDIFFPRIFVRRKQFVPAGTVSLTIYFHADQTALFTQGDQPVLGHARALRYNAGYFDQVAEIWSTNGELLATTSQIVYFKG